MANKDHLTLLNRSKIEWSRWRDSDPTTRPDLRGLVARSANLSGITFQDAVLERADLMRSNLNKARFERTELRCALLNEWEKRCQEPFPPPPNLEKRCQEPFPPPPNLALPHAIEATVPECTMPALDRRFKP
jgi:Pentapeptide repeats (8 copies)